MLEQMLEGVSFPELIATVSGFVLVCTLAFAICHGAAKQDRKLWDFITEVGGNGIYLLLILGLFAIGAERGFWAKTDEEGNREVRITKLEGYQAQLIASLANKEIVPLTQERLKELATVDNAAQEALQTLVKINSTENLSGEIPIFRNPKTGGFLLIASEKPTVKAVSIGNPLWDIEDMNQVQPDKTPD